MSSLTRFLYPAAFTFLPPLSIFSLNYLMLLYYHEHEIDVGHWLQGVDSSVPPWLLGGSWLLAATSFGYGAYMLWRNEGVSRNSLAIRMYTAHLVFTHLNSLLKLSVCIRTQVQLLGTITVFSSTVLCCYHSYKADHRAGCLMLPLLSLYTYTCWARIRSYYYKKKMKL